MQSLLLPCLDQSARDLSNERHVKQIKAKDGCAASKQQGLSMLNPAAIQPFGVSAKPAIVLGSRFIWYSLTETALPSTTIMQ